MTEHLQEAAAYFARMELWREIREKGQNWHPRIREYWLGQDPPLDIAKLAKKPPWCAVFIQFVTDLAATHLGIKNPLNDVKLEAYVQSYVDWAEREGRLLAAGDHDAKVGDLVVFSFGGKRYDHIAIVVRPEVGSEPIVGTIEGNTGDVNQREGDGLYEKTRNLSRNKARLIRWA